MVIVHFNQHRGNEMLGDLWVRGAKRRRRRCHSRIFHLITGIWLMYLAFAVA
jgi:hypothetical protein